MRVVNAQAKALQVSLWLQNYIKAGLQVFSKQNFKF